MLIIRLASSVRLTPVSRAAISYARTLNRQCQVFDAIDRDANFTTDGFGGMDPIGCRVISVARAMNDVPEISIDHARAALVSLVGRDEAHRIEHAAGLDTVTGEAA